MTAKRGWSLLLLLVLLGSLVVPQAGFAAGLGTTTGAVSSSGTLVVTVSPDAGLAADATTTVTVTPKTGPGNFAAEGPKNGANPLTAGGAAQTFEFPLSGEKYGKYTWLVTFGDGSTASGSYFYNAPLTLNSATLSDSGALKVNVTSPVAGATVQVLVNHSLVTSADVPSGGVAFDITANVPGNLLGSLSGSCDVSVRYMNSDGYGSAAPSLPVTVGTSTYGELSLSTSGTGNTLSVSGTADAHQKLTITVFAAADPATALQTAEVTVKADSTYAYVFQNIGAGKYNVTAAYKNNPAKSVSKTDVEVEFADEVSIPSAKGGNAGEAVIALQLNWVPTADTAFTVKVGGVSGTVTVLNGTLTTASTSVTLTGVPGNKYYNEVTITGGPFTDKVVAVPSFYVMPETQDATAIYIRSASSPASSNQVLVTASFEAGRRVRLSFGGGKYTQDYDDATARAGTYNFDISGVAAGTYTDVAVSYTSGASGSFTWGQPLVVGDAGERAPISIDWAGLYSPTRLAATLSYEKDQAISVSVNGGTPEIRFDDQHVGYTTVDFPFTKPDKTTDYVFTAEYTTVPKKTATFTYTYTVSDTAENIKLTLSADSNSIRASGSAEKGKSVAVALSGASTASETLTATDGTFYKLFSGLGEGSYTVSAAYVDGSGIGATSTTTVAALSSLILQVDRITNATTVIVGKTLAGLKATVRTTLGGTAFTASATADARGVFRIPLTQPQAVGKDVVVEVLDASGATHTFTYTVVQDSATIYRNLQLYSSGSDVSALQQRLKDLSYDVDVTGYYDLKTQAAVRSFQYINGIGLDGIAGHETQNMLYSVAARPYTTDGTTYARLQRGDRGSAVSLLQTRLTDLGYYTIRIDGIFGVATQAGVRAFQVNNGLAGTGIADDVTQQVLFGSTAKAIGSAPNVYINLRRGSRGTEVRNLQTRLSYLGYYTGLIDGIYGSQTEAAVRRFQGKNNLSRSGTADTATQTVLFSNNAWSSTGGGSSSGSSGSTSTGYVYLYWGCENEAVKRLQTALKDLGYYSGKIDGQYYNQTYNAVRAFQKANGLAVDGIAGRKTQNKLYGTNY